MKNSRKKVVVFGVFDKLHDGHKDFLNQAKKLGDELHVILARDEMVIHHKKKTPTHSLEERINAIIQEGIANAVYAGDAKPSEWKLLIEIAPDVIALGYDQHDLERSLMDAKSNFPFEFKIIKLEPHKSDVFHTSILK